MWHDLLVIIVLTTGILFALRQPFYGILLYMWVAHFRPTDWAYAGWLTSIPMADIAAGLTLMLMVIQHRRYPVALFHWAVLGFVVQGALSAQYGVNPEVSWQWYQTFLPAAITSYIITVLVDREDRLRLALIVLVVSMGIEPAKQGLVTLVLRPGAANMNNMNSVGDNNGVGLAMAMLLPITLSLIRTSTIRWERWGLILFCVGLLHRCLTTYSRGTFLTLGVLGLLVILRGRHKVRNLVGIVLISIISWNVMPDAFHERMATINQFNTEDHEMEYSAASRLHLWHTATIMANDRPLQGVGFGAYSAAYRDYDPSQGAYGLIKEAHGSLPGVLADTGYPGLLLYLLVLGTAMWGLVRARRLASFLEPGSVLFEYATGLQYAIIAFLVGGAFLSFMYFEIVWHILALSVVVSILVQEQLRQESRTRLEHSRRRAEEAEAQVIEQPPDLPPVAVPHYRPQQGRPPGPDWQP